MKRKSYYDIIALPALGELGSTPPIGLVQLLERLAGSSGPRVLVETLFLFDDLLQREAFLAGEIEEVSPAVLTSEQVRNESPLPIPMYIGIGITSDVEEEHGGLEIDGLWATCFRHAGAVARQHGSVFLADWVGYEVALRNALAAARAQRLGLEESGYLVATELAAEDEDLTEVLSKWTAAPTPLAELRGLIEARWAWLGKHDAWFTFSDDELAAYAAKLMLLHQWRRLATASEDTPVTEETKQLSDTLERTTR